MTQEQIKDAVRSFLQVSKSGDIEKALLFLDNDAEVADSGKTFKGPNEIREYLNGMMNTLKHCTITETGMGIIAESNVGVVEYILSGTYLSGIVQGMRIEIPVVGIYEFKNDKIQSIRGFSDKWRLARQTSEGSLNRWMENRPVVPPKKHIESQHESDNRAFALS